jgi:FtsZ-binding cell division protein ZapB
MSASSSQPAPTDPEIGSDVEHELSNVRHKINLSASQTMREFERLVEIIKRQELKLRKAAISGKRTLTLHRTRLKEEREKTGRAFNETREANKRRDEATRNNEELRGQLAEATRRIEELQGTVATLRTELVQVRGVICPICYDRVVQIAVPCGHCFCQACHKSWADSSTSPEIDDIEFVDENHAELMEDSRMSCPVCRGDYDKRAVLRLVLSH